MASEGESFGHSGPSFLTTVDWSNSDHRRSIAASLVKGAYVMERDRQKNRQGPQALAPPWWQFFNFKQNEVLVDNQDQSYFGAIYEFSNPNPCNHSHPDQRPPQFVIAFRGTIIKPCTVMLDFRLDLDCMINKLHNSSRVNMGLERTLELVKKVGPGNIWLAGHSLGSSVALLVGRNMIIKHKGIHLETYLFNPPFTSPPIERITNDKLKLGVRVANSVLRAGLAAAVGGPSSESEESDPFTLLSTWVPYLFINPSDPICSEYVGYFEHREKMKSIGLGKIEELATKHSVRSIVSGATGKGSEPARLIPNASLTINSSPSQSFKEAHGIRQWWTKNLECQAKSYHYKWY